MSKYLVEYITFSGTKYRFVERFESSQDIIEQYYGIAKELIFWKLCEPNYVDYRKIK